MGCLAPGCESWVFSNWFYLAFFFGTGMPEPETDHTAWRLGVFPSRSAAQHQASLHGVDGMARNLGFLHCDSASNSQLLTFPTQDADAVADGRAWLVAFGLLDLSFWYSHPSTTCPRHCVPPAI